MGGSRGADFMITRTRGNPWQINFDFTTERNLLPCHPERSKNYAKRSSHGVEGPLAPERKDGREKGISTTAPWGGLPAAPMLTLSYMGSFDCVGSFVKRMIHL